MVMRVKSKAKTRAKAFNAEAQRKDLRKTEKRGERQKRRMAA